MLTYISGEMVFGQSLDALEPAVDLGIVAAIVMLVGWAIAALVFEGPGWVHGFLTVGMFLLIYRIVKRGTPDAPKGDAAAAAATKTAKPKR